MTNRIAIISEHASPTGVLGTVDCGGQNVYVGQIARHLAASGYQVDIFTRRDSTSLPETVNWSNGVRIVNVPAGPARFVRKEQLLPHMAEFTDCTLSWMRRQARPYDLVHANFWMSGLVAADLKSILRLPFVITFHALGRVRRQFQGKADGFPDERFAIEDRIVREADHIIAECPQDEDDLIHWYKADPARMSIIPCGFDPAELWPVNKQAARLHLGLNRSERLLLQLGRMVPRKGVDVAIRGLARLIHNQQLPARLLVVGGESIEPDRECTPELDRLRAIAREENVENYVTFTRHCERDRLRYYYSAADVFITTPWYEPFGITPVEAMACGTPVVGYAVGGIKSTVHDGKTG